jgi:hypothetical protein
MGFHKRWINKEVLIIRYKDGGLDSVKTYLSADALILSDEFSYSVLTLLNNKKDDDAKKLLEDGDL